MYPTPGKQTTDFQHLQSPTGWKWMVLVCFLILPSLYIQGQDTIVRCAADAFLEEALKQRPELKEKRVKWEQELQEHIKEHRALPRTNITIPVVFHLVWHTEEQNISDLQIYDQLEILNRAFSMQNRNLHTVRGQFRHLISDVQIEFCLAKRDPDGMPTTGITRTQTDVEGIGNERIDFTKRAVHFSEYGGKDLWDPGQYLNIWVCEIGGNILGSATFPNSAPYPEAEGVVVDYRAIGSIGTGVEKLPFADGGKTLVHEIGHYFNLHHPWGPGSGSCDTDDFVGDTPNQIGPYRSCSNETTESCGSEDIVTNFMDYPEDQCLAMFTHGQKERMIASLELHRQNLLESDVCNPPGGPTEENADLTEIQVNWFPGPQRIGLFAARQGDYSLDIEVFDMAGRLVFSERTSFGRVHMIGFEGYPSGVYIICLRDDQDRECSQVVVY